MGLRTHSILPLVLVSYLSTVYTAPFKLPIIIGSLWNKYSSNFHLNKES